jgi:hypothetical protein
MQALSSFRYALLLWLYGDVQAARDESEKAMRKVEQIRAQTLPAVPALETEPWTVAAGSCPAQMATH